jgi:cytidyltransferase-like protein
MPNSSRAAREKKIIPFTKLSEMREVLAGKKIVHCHGVFDVIHAGHLAHFESARKFGDVLVVTLTSDFHVNKGPGRPYFNSNIRANMVAALELVDFVAVSDFPTAVPSIEALRPHFYVKGPDYRDKSKDASGAIYKEELAAEKYGGEMVFTDDDTFSSSALINSFFPAWNDEQQATIEAIRRAGGVAVVEEILTQLSTLKIALLGEPIVDTYVFCTPEAISSKSPSISARYLHEEDYAGGSLAIANHLADFVGSITLMTTHGGEDWFLRLLDEKLDRRVKLEALALAHTPTPRKTRFIADDKVQRLFELTNIKDDQWHTNSPKDFLQLLRRNTANIDALIVADFGHGLIEDDILEELAQSKGFVAANVQTNSSNFGFNPFTKHKRFSYLSIDLKEARVAFQDRFSASLDLAVNVREKCANLDAGVSMTLGPMGSFYLPPGTKKEIKVPAFTDVVVDAVGAGDAYFALTSVLIRAGVPDIFVPFLGNVFAGLKTKIIGNKASVTRAQLIRAVTFILKT